MAKGKIYLIPVPISEGALHTLPPQVAQTIPALRHYFVENLRTARRSLKLIDASVVIDDLSFSEIDKHTGADKKQLKDWLRAGHSIGVMSEAGCPGVADPGAEIVALAQELGAEVVPLVGPNSLILALMASGLNGQGFAFQGYLPVKEPARGQRIRQLEALSKKEHQTQIFIETPYRNNQLLGDLLKHCQGSTRICIASDITGAQQQIRTQTADAWSKARPVLEKLPAVFLMLAS